MGHMPDKLLYSFFKQLSSPEATVSFNPEDRTRILMTYLREG